jgi:hypothetical protein
MKFSPPHRNGRRINRAKKGREDGRRKENTNIIKKSRWGCFFVFLCRLQFWGGSRTKRGMMWARGFLIKQKKINLFVTKTKQHRTGNFFFFFSQQAIRRFVFFFILRGPVHQGTLRCATSDKEGVFRYAEYAKCWKAKKCWSFFFVCLAFRVGIQNKGIAGHPAHYLYATHNFIPSFNVPLLYCLLWGV